MSETIIYAIFFIGIFISEIIYVIRFLKTPHFFKTIFKGYLAFLERDTFPKPKKRKSIKVKNSNHWDFLFKEKYQDMKNSRRNFQMKNILIIENLFIPSRLIGQNKLNCPKIFLVAMR